MWICALGYATTSRSYEKGRSGERVTMQAVACEDRAFNIVCSEDDVLPTMTPVVVTGDLRVFDRSWSLVDGTFRKADGDWLTLLAGLGNELAEELLAGSAERADYEAAASAGGLAGGAGGGEVDPGPAPSCSGRRSASAGEGSGE